MFVNKTKPAYPIYTNANLFIDKKKNVIGSRIRERDKKNAEYYVGDYYSKKEISLIQQ